MTSKSKSGEGRIPDRPTPEEAREYLSRQPNAMGLPDGPLRTLFDKFLFDRTGRRGPANFEDN